MQVCAVALRVAKHLLWLLVVPALLVAQGLRGTVVSRAGSPVSGVVVLMLDDRDSVMARSLTNEDGAYRVSGSGPGGYRLRTLRIGFRPWTSERIQLTLGQELFHTLTLSEVPISLDTVRVAGRSTCQTPKDSATATFALWEQARTALTATQLTAGSRGIEATIVTYQRSLEPDRERVTSHRSSIVSGLTRGLWTSASIDSLRRAGYIVTSPLDGSTIYWAPDLRVLLSNHFIEDHCFRLAQSRDTTRIGIEFEPTRERRTVPGIRGTLWLDRKSAELRRMEFRYTNATREQQFGNAGGNMEFARGSNGAWIISGWNIRMPVLAQRETRMSGLSGSRATSTELRVESIELEGGEVALLMRGRDTIWARAPMPLVGAVVDSATGVAIADADVSLRGTALRATTDRVGRFRIPDVLPGEYTAEVRTKALSAFGFVQSVPVTFTDTAVPHTLKLPSAAQVANAACGTSRNDRGMVVGTVRLQGDATPQANIKVVASWSDQTPTAKRWGGRDGRTDASGTFRICDVPLNTTVTVSADNAAPVEARLHGLRRYVVADLVLEPGMARGAAFAGVVVTDVNGQPLADVEVAVPEISRSVYTDERGAFRIENIPPGTRTITARRVGYQVLGTQVEFSANRTVEQTLVLRQVATLDTVAVTAWVGPGDFEEHRKLGFGKFLTRADIDKLQGMSIANRLSELRGTGMVRGERNEAYILSSTRANTRADEYWCPGQSERIVGQSSAPCGCYAKVYVDNVLMNPGVVIRTPNSVTRPTPPFDVNTIMTMSIEAVEWYAGPSETPPKYMGPGSSCGVLVIHTRRGR